MLSSVSKGGGGGGRGNRTGLSLSGRTVAFCSLFVFIAVAAVLRYGQTNRTTTAGLRLQSVSTSEFRDAATRVGPCEPVTSQSCPKCPQLVHADTGDELSFPRRAEARQAALSPASAVPNNAVQYPRATSTPSLRWGERQIVQFLLEHPSRAFFSRLFRDGGFRVGMEIGVADGRFSENFLRDNAGLPNWVWYMVEPFPNDQLKGRFPSNKHGTADFHSQKGAWAQQGIGGNAHKVFVKKMSNEPQVLRDLADNSFDFIYLDGAHDYKNVKLEMKNIWPKLRPGGVFAGHDYCDYREKPHPPCRGCDTVPLCTVYTTFNKDLSGKKVKSQWGVVQAVHEWLHESHPELTVYNTQEDFTRQSLAAAGMEYDLVLTKTRNPSWFIVKPL